MKATCRFLFIMTSMLMLTTGFSGCSDDNDGADSSIIGTWAYEEDYGDGDYYYEEITFKANGTFILESVENYYGDYSTETLRGTWEIEGDELIVDIDGDHLEIRIVSISSNKLVLEDYEDDERMTYYKV